MAYENRQYLIIPTSELPNVDFSVVMETSADTVRKSVDQTKTFVKWQGAAPGFTTTMLRGWEKLALHLFGLE